MSYAALPSGDAELADPFTQLLRIRDGQIAEVVNYWDPEEARRDAGLEAVPGP
jgi:ketosteroid isomerase-like protein